MTRPASLFALPLLLWIVGACSSRDRDARSPEEVAVTEKPGRLEPATPTERQLLERLDSLATGELLSLEGTTVTADAIYTSASGSKCRRVSFVSDQKQQPRLACRDEQGWFFVPDVFGGAP